MKSGNGGGHLIHPGATIADMKPRPSSGATEPTIYRIVVRGELSRRYLPAFEGMTLAPGDGETAIIGPVVDQAQLHGLLDRVGDLGLELVSVNAAPEPAVTASAADSSERWRRRRRGSRRRGRDRPPGGRDRLGGRPSLSARRCSRPS